ncbi:rwd domain-containing protein [Ophiostoma piceae UAMH 11346]|uniref:Rwd domain-containing protein n=1 Tax=Ophiostoma piceae (strain UAMH 11346) TaxID=1262450 RepID=S3CRI4_OPHP1|nr:rwd domain-containing protein [Ophiostoma piceae UAMH 11346]
MGLEDQQEEIEVLESIFPDELTKTEDNEFRIAIKLDLPDDVIEATKPDDWDPEDEYEAPVMILSVKYPEDYPDKEPNLDLSPPPQQHEQHPLFSVADDKDELLAGLTETIEENLGMAMVFTIVSALKDAAEQLIITRHEAIVKEKEDAAREAEREENKKFHGSAVTPESFVKWQTAFLQEMADVRQREEEQAAAELAKKVRGGGGPGGVVGKDGTRLTGRQLWEQGLAGKVDEDADDDDDDSVPTGDVQKLKIDS